MEDLRKELIESVESGDFYGMTNGPMDWIEVTDEQAVLEFADAIKHAQRIVELSDEEAEEGPALEMLEERNELSKEDQANTHVYLITSYDKEPTYIMIF